MFERPFLGQVRLASAMTSIGIGWWRHHIAFTRAYLEAALAKDVPGSLDALKELWKAIQSWQELAGVWSQGVLMAEHTALAKLLIDCYVTGEGTACQTTAVNALLRNVDAQRMLFPVQPDVFADLFEQHVKLTGAYIGDLAAGKMDDFTAHYSQALENGRALGAFTDQAFSL
jgi:hypothetical protein